MAKKPEINIPMGRPGPGGPSISRILFDKYDEDKSGTINKKEFHSLCYEMGHYLSEQELDFAMKMIDRDGSGTLDYDEFMKWYRSEDKLGKLHLDEDQLEQLSRSSNYFKYWDKDNSGSIDKNEFKGLYADLVKNKLTYVTLEACLADLDANGDGQIQFNEYIEWLVKLGSLPIKLITK